MKVFITGITGFAGVHLAEHLLASGHEVAGCSSRATWPRHVSEGLADRVSLFAWDVTQTASEEVLQRLLAFAPEAVVHLAAISVPADCGTDEPNALALAVNVEGVRQVIRLATRFDIKPRILFASSCHVYQPVDAAGIRVDEQWPTEPLGAYAKTKLAAETVAQEMCEREGLDWLIARAFQHSGPGQSTRMMLPHWVQQFAASDAEPIRVHTLDSYLDLSDVRDVARAYRILLERGHSATIYNVGSGCCWRSGDIFNILRNRYDPNRKVIETSPRRTFHPIADISLILNDTGWRPSIPLDHTIEDTWRYWKQEMRA